MTEITAQEEKNSLKTWLFNPFYYVAGGPALALGLAIIVVASVNGSVSNSHFDGVFDFHTGRHVPLWFFVFEGLVDWAALGIVLWVSGLLISKSRVRVIDVFGTQALARYPSLVTVVFALLPGYQRAGAQLAAMNFQIGLADAAAFGFTVFIIFVVLVWMVVLMYRAFAISCNVKGAKAVVSFIVAALVAEVLSTVILVATLKMMLS